MAKHKILSEAQDRANGPEPLTTEEQSSPMGEKQYSNGPLLDHDHSSVTKAIASKKAVAWIKSNWLTLIGVAIPAGLLWLLPVTRWQLEDVKTDIRVQVSEVRQKVENHDSAIAEIKATISRVDAKTDAILLKLTPERYSEVPPSSPPIEKTKSKPKRAHAQRSPIAKALGIR